MLTRLEKLKLRLLRTHYGESTTAEQALEEALRFEKIKKQLGPHDPAFNHFSYHQASCEMMALLLEKEGS